MLSAEFSVEGSTAVQAHSVAYGQTVDFALQSLSDVSTIAWSIVGTSKSTQAALAITLGGSPSGETASCVMPSDPGDDLGRSFLMKCLVTNARGQTAVAYRLFGAVNSAGEMPVASGEENHRSITHGYTDEFNRALATLSLGLALGDATDAGDKPEWNGSIWIKRRFWITPDIDLTGATDATTAINNAAAVRKGGCVYLPDGIIKIGTSGVSGPASIFTLPHGVTITGNERGLSMGHRVYDPGITGLNNTGPLLRVYGKGKLFVGGQQGSVRNVEIHYPDQPVNATPDTGYDWTFFLDNGNHGFTVQNVTVNKAFKFYYNNCAGGVLENVWGQVLSRGVQLARCADVIRGKNIHFGNVDYQTGATLTAWIQANCRYFSFDGAEDFVMEQCFAYGGNEGIVFEDEDSDGFRGCYGKWIGGGLDIMNTLVKVEEPNGLTLRGFKMTDAALVANASGVGFYFLDTNAAANQDQRPSIYIKDCTVHGSHERTVWQPAGYSNFFARGGSWQGFTAQGILAQAGNSYALLDGVAMQEGSAGGRVATSGGALVTDINKVDLPVNGSRPTYTA